MIEVRFHGRGGQGVVTAATILADAFFKEGKFVQAFPFFGVERRGAPVSAFARISNEEIRVKSEIYYPDYVIVLDSALLSAVNVVQGLKEDGLVLINTDKNVDINAKKIAVVDATEIAIKYNLGSKISPIVNTAILGAFAKVSNLVKLESIINAIIENSPTKKQENANAARDAYESVKFLSL